MIFCLYYRIANFITNIVIFSRCSESFDQISYVNLICVKRSSSYNSTLYPLKMIVRKSLLQNPISHLVDLPQSCEYENLLLLRFVFYLTLPHQLTRHACILPLHAVLFIVVPFSASSEDKLGATEVCVLLSEPQTDEDEMLLVPAGQQGGLDGVLQCRHPLTDLTTLPM